MVWFISFITIWIYSGIGYYVYRHLVDTEFFTGYDAKGNAGLCGAFWILTLPPYLINLGIKKLLEKE